MKKWWIGCSGFFYRHWKEAFYPKDVPQRKWFEYYCESFNTVELNVTFYRYPKLEALRGWYNRSPDHFRFTVKAPRLITHYKKFNNALREARDFYELAGKGLRDKLGCVLFQLPSNMVCTDANIEKILNTLDTAFVNVIEFRHESWWNESVYKVLRQNKITFCSISYPDLPEDVIRSVPVMYYRFHGVPKLYTSPYSKKQLTHIADRIAALRGVDEVYCYFNNDAQVEAIRNARQLAALVESMRGQTHKVISRK